MECTLVWMELDLLTLCICDRRSVGICAAKKLMVPESVCGRPLGLQFYHKTGELYVADAYLGLMRVPARGGMAEVVATKAGGVPFNFLNGLDVDQNTGDVYFTDSSATYRRRYTHIGSYFARCWMHLIRVKFLPR